MSFLLIIVSSAILLFLEYYNGKDTNIFFKEKKFLYFNVTKLCAFRDNKIAIIKQ